MRPTRLSRTALDPCNSQLASYSSDALSQLKNDGIEKVQMLVPVKEAERSYAFDASNLMQLGSFVVDEGRLKSVLHTFTESTPTATGRRS
jgi:midasin